jgi:hypothetical protein
MIRNVVGTAIGITMTRRILGFSQEYHDNYIVSEYTFRNDSARTLTGVLFFFQYRIGISYDAGYALGVPVSWGFNTMIDTRGDSVKNDSDDLVIPHPDNHVVHLDLLRVLLDDVFLPEFLSQQLSDIGATQMRA